MSETLPPRITFEDRASFAAFTLRERFPVILRMVERCAEGPARRRLRLLIDSVPLGALPPHLGSTPEERAFWDLQRQSWPASARWADLPFFEAEFAFYRAILDAVGFDSHDRTDPFIEAKRKALATAISMLESAATRAAELTDWSPAFLRSALGFSLRGNAQDLSQLNREPGQARGSDAPELLIDDSTSFIHDIETTAPERVAFVLDNVGGELVGDLVLLDYLLRVLPNVQIRVYAKPAPIFVSDATEEDWQQMVRTMANHPSIVVRELAIRLDRYQASGRLVLSAGTFWSRPLWLSQVDGALRRELTEVQLIIIKGDLNYRRYVGDRHWPLSSPTRQHRCQDLPPVLALRVLKSEVLVGLPPERARTLLDIEPDALTSGENSLLQYFR